jgi:hypothetical protein
MIHSRTLCPLKPRVILLDLNYTLVENSSDTMMSNRSHAEMYRLWLVDLLRDKHVALVTVRHVSERDETLDRIAAQTGGWQPQETHFREDMRMKAPEWKGLVYERRIAPAHDLRGVLAIESNTQVHRRYDTLGVPWVKIGTGDRWTSLPIW